MNVVAAFALSSERPALLMEPEPFDAAFDPAEVLLERSGPAGSWTAAVGDLFGVV